MKKIIYVLAIASILLSSCKATKKPYRDTKHVAGVLVDTEQMNSNNTVNFYGAKRKEICKVKWKVKWKNCFLHKKKYNQTVKDSLMKLHVQFRKKALTSPYIVVQDKDGKRFNIFVDEIIVEQIKAFQNSNKDKAINLMFQGELINEGQLKAVELTSIFVEK